MAAHSLLAAVGLAVLVPAAAAAEPFRFRPEATVEIRAFPQAPASSEQFRDVQPSLVLGGKGRWEDPDRGARILFEPHLRLDARDGERTEADLREASLALRRGDWDLLVGASRVFWGVAEARNVVDVINQTDALADVDEEEKLGQPMVRLSNRGAFGTVEAYWLPCFRERRFPGREGRLRTDPPVDADAARFDRDGGRWAGDVALRHTARLGGFDVGTHVFHGTARTPRLAGDLVPGRLVPVYQSLTQAGAEVQYTTGAWLLTGEAVAGRVGGTGFHSAVGGVEYTLYDLRGTGLDLGLIAEVLHDERDRDRAPVTVFERDVFVGTRLVWNDVQDTELLAGAIVDVRTGATQASVELQRRIGDDLMLEAVLRVFTASGDRLVAPFARDDHAIVRLTRYF
jgi:hypothetical protein